MTFIADGATQRNFMLPKLRKRPPKELATKELFCSKLYGVFLYGYGMSCYVVHESVGGGANLNCTCTYLTLIDALKSGRPIPEEIHLQLDNTTGENKCVTVICFAGWLVKMGFCRRVRLFFLPKGHTHVIIDQIFGCITKYIRARHVYTFKSLLGCIRDVLSKATKYNGKCTKRLHHLYDWASMFYKRDSGLGGFATGEFQGDGYHDFHIKLNDEGEPVMNLKKYGCTEEWALDNDIKIFKAGAWETMPKQPPVAEIKGDDAWDRMDFEATIRAYEAHFGIGEEKMQEIRGEWRETIDDTATSTSSIKTDNVIPFPTFDVAEGGAAQLLRSDGVTSIWGSHAYCESLENPPVCTVFGGGISKGLLKNPN